MAQCKQCFGPIDGRTTQITCSECNSPMHKDCTINFGGADFCDVCFTIAQEKPKSKFGDFELPEFIRRTHIETYRDCEYKFYQEVIKGHSMPPNIYTQMGSDLHELFELAIKGELQAPESMKLHFKTLYWDKYHDDLFTETGTRERMWVRAMDSIDTFYTVLPNIGNVFVTEETIFTNIGDNIPDVRITMDLITERDGELEMHDWKTGRVMVGQRLSSDLQAPLYIYSVINKYNKPVRSFTFYYLQENKTRVFIRSEKNPEEYICTVGKREYKVNLTDAIREVKSIFSRIKKGDFQPRHNKNKYFVQRMCHLKELGLCCQDLDPWNQI